MTHHADRPESPPEPIGLRDRIGRMIYVGDRITTPGLAGVVAVGRSSNNPNSRIEVRTRTGGTWHVAADAVTVTNGVQS